MLSLVADDACCRRRGRAAPSSPTSFNHVHKMLAEEFDCYPPEPVQRSTIKLPIPYSIRPKGLCLQRLKTIDRTLSKTELRRRTSTPKLLPWHAWHREADHEPRLY